jgi:phosphoribosylglycinamide formyltransferase 1
VVDDTHDHRRIAVLVSGSGTNLQCLIDAVSVDDDFGGEIVVVGSDRPDAIGLRRASRHGIETVATPITDHPDRPTWERHLGEMLADHQPEIVVLAGFMRILSGAFLTRWPDRIVNVHPSLLPAFPGAHAVRDALAHGVKVTGATVHLVEEQVDHGPIIAQQAVRVREDDDEQSLHRRIQEVEHELLPASVKLVCHDRVSIDGRRVHIRRADEAAALTTLDAEPEGGPQ